MPTKQAAEYYVGDGPALDPSLSDPMMRDVVSTDPIPPVPEKQAQKGAAAYAVPHDLTPSSPMNDSSRPTVARAAPQVPASVAKPPPAQYRVDGPGTPTEAPVPAARYPGAEPRKPGPEPYRMPGENPAFRAADPAKAGPERYLVNEPRSPVEYVTANDAPRASAQYGAVREVSGGAVPYVADGGHPALLDQRPPVGGTAAPFVVSKGGIDNYIVVPPRYPNESDEDFLVRANLRSEWDTTVCSCLTDIGSCLEVMFCHYCQASAQTSKLSTGITGMRVCPCVMMMVGDLVLLGTPLMACSIRKRLRARYGIAGDPTGDFALSFCCPQCVICQNYREMCVRGDIPGGVCCTTVPYSRAPAKIK